MTKREPGSGMMRRGWLALLVLLAFAISCDQSSSSTVCSTDDPLFDSTRPECPLVGESEIVVPGKTDFDRGQFSGSLDEYDPGPPLGSGWAELFASVPNYRRVARELGDRWLLPDPNGETKLSLVNAELLALGQPEIPEYTLSGEKFRYTMGPLFYRGRLDGTARVLVVGQEGATDEAMVHRAFVGGAGQKIQNFLNSIGITKSYLMVNTFVYSIFEQFDPFTKELAETGPIKDHRNAILEKIYQENPIELIITVGSAAHGSVGVWIDELHGGKLRSGVRRVFLMHPGAAAFAYDKENPEEGPTNPEVLDAVVSSFTKGWDRIWYWKYRYAGWLKSDDDGWTYQGSKFYYGDMNIPWRDLPFGIQRYIGRGGTMTERSDGGLRVALRSSNGVRYEVPYARFPSTISKPYSGYQTRHPLEVAWEPPKLEAELGYDLGPGQEWATLFLETPTQQQVADEAGVTVTNDFDAPVWHRGRTDGSAKVLVLAQNYSFDGFIAGRTLCGDTGQKLNDFLERLGVGSSYLFVTPYPFSPYALDDDQLRTLAATPILADFRKRVIEKVLTSNAIELVVLVGAIGQESFAPFREGFSGTVVELGDPRDRAVYAEWNEALRALEGLSFLPSEPELYVGGKTGFNNVRQAIPRGDLPFGKPLWFGTSGDLSEQVDPSWLFWNAPRWITREPIDEGTEIDTEEIDPTELVPKGPPNVWINELHYDNISGDVDEGIEIAGTAGSDLSRLQLVFYSVSSTATSVVSTVPLAGLLSDQQNGFGTLWFAISGIQNGGDTKTGTDSPDGVALVYDGTTVLQFLSWEGTITATDGPANGLTSQDIGVREYNSPSGTSLQLTGSGTTYADFSWSEPQPKTHGDDRQPGGINIDQSFGK
ncbi:MAG: hypothetical protein KC609_16595 [Myxococcales bacterium]|nr:hypothetical protein [Myxococcales bacterium]